MKTGHPSTRAVNSGSGNRDLESSQLSYYTVRKLNCLFGSIPYLMLMFRGLVKADNIVMEALRHIISSYLLIMCMLVLVTSSCTLLSAHTL